MTRLLDIGQPVDFIWLDEAKTIDEVQNKQLNLKLKVYEIYENIVLWIESLFWCTTVMARLYFLNCNQSRLAYLRGLSWVLYYSESTTMAKQLTL